MKRFNPAFLVAFALVGTMTLTTMRPSLAVQEFTTFACATVAACVIGNNSGTGPGVQGIAKSNAGVLGQSTSGSGVRGTSSSTSGVVGTTSTGAQAILGQAVNTIGVKGSTTSASGGGIGVQGLNAAFGTGVAGTSTNGIGVSGLGSHSVGVFGNGNTGVEALDIGGASPPANRTVLFADGFGGQLFRANNSHGIDNLTVADTSSGLQGGITTAFAIVAGSANVGTGVNANGGFAGVQGSAATANAFGVQGNNTSNASSIAVRANSFGGNEFVGNGSNGADNFIVDNSGNVFAHSFNASSGSINADAGRCNHFNILA